MPEPVIVACPACGARLKLKNRENLGIERPCMQCGVPFVLRAEEEIQKSPAGTGLQETLSKLAANKPTMIGGGVALFVLLSFLVFMSLPSAEQAPASNNASDEQLLAQADTQEPSNDDSEKTEPSDPFEEEIDATFQPVMNTEPVSPKPAAEPQPKPSFPSRSQPKPQRPAERTEPVQAPPQKPVSRPEPPSQPAKQSSRSASNSWPQWRGPNRDGISTETGLLKSWPNDGPPLLWRASGVGRGYSSVAIANGRIYTMGRVRGETQLICLDDADGSPVWSTRVGGGADPNCTPTVDMEGGLVFGISHAGDLLCADTENGEEQWRKNFGRDFGGQMMSDWGYSESPLVDGDKLICTPGASNAMLAALDKQTGRPIWETPVSSTGSAGKDGAGYSSVVISNAGGTRQYVQLVGRGVIGVSAANGQLLWGYNRVANRTANVPTPVINRDDIFCSTGYGDGGTALLRLSGRGRGLQAREVYYKSANELQNHHGGMVLVGNHVYFGEGHNNGFPACVELSSGRNVWGRTQGAGSGSAGVTYAEGRLYFRYEDGVMALIEANPSRYNLISSFREQTGNGKAWAHPVICNGRLYLRDQDELLCYDIREH